MQTNKSGANVLITGIRCNSLSLIKYFNNFNPFFVGRSTSESIISMSDPSAFSASTTCLADLTDVTVKTNTVTRISRFEKTLENLKKRFHF